MSSLNTKKIITLTQNLTNFQLLERSTMSTLLWEDSFYEDGISVNERIRDLITLCYSEGRFKDIIALIKKVKFDMKLRHTPLFMIRCLVRLVKELEEKKEISSLLIKCITRADDITEFMVMYFTDESFKEKKQPIANYIKDSLSEAFLKFDEYSIAKYADYGKKVSLKDAMCLLRVKPKTEEQSSLFKRLIEKQLKTPDTWEVEISKTKDKKASWERLLCENKLGGLALLRNIRNMKEAGVDALEICKGIDSISSKLLLPINFISSYLINPEFSKQLEDKFYECFNKDKKLKGKTLVLLDVSGSMSSPISSNSKMQRVDVAGALGIILNEICEYLSLVAFDTKHYDLPNSKGFELISKLRSYGGGTNLYSTILAFKDHDANRVIIITDEQDTSIGRPTLKIFNDNKQYYIINVSPYKKGVDFRKDEISNVLRINGWSDKVVDYIMEIENN